jgi:hypothetical protein
MAGLGSSLSRQRSGLLELLQGTPDPFWSWHWNLHAARLDRPQPLLGPQRVTDLAVNVVLPWLQMRAVIGGNQELRKVAEQRYFAWPAAEDNATLRLARARMFGETRNHLFRSAALQQGLLQIERDFCQQANALCEHCPFPDLLQQQQQQRLTSPCYRSPRRACNKAIGAPASGTATFLNPSATTPTPRSNPLRAICIRHQQRKGRQCQCVGLTPWPAHAGRVITCPSPTRAISRNRKKGLIAPMEELKIMADAGHVAWDMERFQFLDEAGDFDSIHPSLLRQSRLNNNYGLYEVIPGIYQVRGFDLSDITFVRGKTGWIVIDPLGAETCARRGSCSRSTSAKGCRSRR